MILTFDRLPKLSRLGPRGFTLLEMMVTIGLLGLGMVAMTAVFNQISSLRGQDLLHYKAEFAAKSVSSLLSSYDTATIQDIINDSQTKSQPFYSPDSPLTPPRLTSGAAMDLGWFTKWKPNFRDSLSFQFQVYRTVAGSLVLVSGPIPPAVPATVPSWSLADYTIMLTVKEIFHPFPLVNPTLTRTLVHQRQLDFR